MAEADALSRGFRQDCSLWGIGRMLNLWALLGRLNLPTVKNYLCFRCYCSVTSDCLWPHELQHTRLPCPSVSPRVCSNSCLLTQWCHPTISSYVTTFYTCPQSVLASRSFPMSSSSHQVAKVLELQHQSFQWIFRVDFLKDWLVWSPCCPRDSQASSPTP